LSGLELCLFVITCHKGYLVCVIFNYNSFLFFTDITTAESACFRTV